MLFKRPTFDYTVDVKDPDKLNMSSLYDSIDFLVKNRITSQIDVNSIKVLSYDIMPCKEGGCSGNYIHRSVLQFRINDTSHEVMIHLKTDVNLSTKLFMAIMDGEYDLVNGVKIGERYLALSHGQA